MLHSELRHRDHSKPAENLPLCPRCSSTETESQCLEEYHLSPVGAFKSCRYRCVHCGTTFISTRPPYAILADPIKLTDSPFLSALSGLSSQDQFPLVGWGFPPQDVCINIGSSPNDVNGDGTDTVNRIFQGRRSIHDPRVQTQFIFVGEASSTLEAYMNIGSSPNVKRIGTTTIDPILLAPRKTYLWGKVTKALFGISMFDRDTISSFQTRFLFVGEASSAQNAYMCIRSNVPFLQAHQSTCRLAKVAKALLGIPASDGYTISSSQSQFPFIGEISSTWDVCIDIDSGPNMKRNDTTTQSTDRWVKLAALVLGISASAGFSSSSNFPKVANATGFIASLTAISLHHAGRAATRILAKFGAIACAAGTLAVIGKDLPEEYTWIASVAFLIPATAVAFA